MVSGFTLFNYRFTDSLLAEIPGQIFIISVLPFYHYYLPRGDVTEDKLVDVGGLSDMSVHESLERDNQCPAYVRC